MKPAEAMTLTVKPVSPEMKKEAVCEEQPLLESADARAKEQSSFFNSYFTLWCNIFCCNLLSDSGEIDVDEVSGVDNISQADGTSLS